MEHAYTIDIDRIISDKRTISCLRNLFSQLKEHGYVTPKTFFNDLSDIDLQTLVELSDLTVDPKVSHEQAMEAYMQLSTCTIGLLIGEGSEINEQLVQDSFSRLITMIACESLARKGLVTVFRENWEMTGDDEKPWVIK